RKGPKMNTIFCVFLSTLILGVNCIVVQLKDGAINGTTTKTKEGRLFHKFLGIPYAQPPIGKLRFKPPKPAEPWNGIKDATNPPPICVQRRDPSPNSDIGQEDCLYLNVYIPDALLNSAGKAPVMVGIHGGAFQTGSANDYAADYFMERDVIFVSMNYRLGVLGFLAVNGLIFGNTFNPISGNFGLKDQSMALKWVKENIGQFGGDSNNVTLIGESAGAASVHFHMFSPLSKGLFQKAIMQSGNAFSPWSHFPYDYKLPHTLLRLDQFFAIKFLNKTDCFATLNKIGCLQDLPAEEFTKEGGLQNYLLYLPTIEKNVRESEPFLPEEPSESNYQTLVPWLTGINSGEGALIVQTLMRNGGSLAKVMNKDKKCFLAMANLYIMTAKKSDMQMLSEVVNYFYFGEQDIGLETAMHATDMITDSSWLNPLVKTVKSGPKVQYLYLYDHRGTFSLQDYSNLTMDLGVCHADEIPLLYRYKRYEDKRSIEDRRVSDTLLKYWINFAISEDPNRHSKERLWQPVQNQDQSFEYLHIKSDGVTMENRMYHLRYDFWKQLPTGLLASTGDFSAKGNVNADLEKLCEYIMS
uniref:carboxylesterase/lipase family protein n=3 Tax=Providencia TaxID=586 RepID=UPI00234BB406